jgi:hypothetical protein
VVKTGVEGSTRLAVGMAEPTALAVGLPKILSGNARRRTRIGPVPFLQHSLTPD